MSLLLQNELMNPPFNRWNSFGHYNHPHNWECYPSPHTMQHPINYHIGPLRWPQLVQDAIHSNAAKATVGKDGYKVCLDVQQFTPEEISVKTVGNSILVEAKHEERKDEFGSISREFTRRYALPPGFNIKDVVTQLSSDGLLTIKAPPEAKALEGGNVRVLQIEHTGPARLGAEKKAEAMPEQDIPDKIKTVRKSK